MSKPLVLGSVLLATIVAFAHPAEAAPGLLHPVMMCVPSREQAQDEALGFLTDGCLFRMSPLFDSTSFSFSPQIAPQKSQVALKRWGARLEFRF